MKWMILPLAMLLAAACSGGGGAKRQDEDFCLTSGVFQRDGRVIFIFKPVKPDISNVAVTGDFNGWKPEGTPLVLSNGQWKLELRLDPGMYEYKYVLNGKLYTIDDCGQETAPDGGGGKNSAVEVK